MRWLIPAVLMFASCTQVGESEQTDAADEQLTATQRRDHAEAIRDVAAAEGLSNAALLGGIAISETNLTHCWRDATWACKGPSSPSCGNGPVIAGAGDGLCALRQGGLGMFQFDAGTFEQTLARDGEDILTLEGNIAQAVDFTTKMVIRDVAGVTTRAQALAWMNSVPMVAGNAKMEQWASITACRYNGCCSTTSTLCKTRRAKYRDNAISIYKEYGASFWNAPNAAGCSEVPAAGLVIDQRSACYTAYGDDQYWRRVNSTSAVGGSAEWTYGIVANSPSNYATWRIRVAAPGRYRVLVNLDGGVHGQTSKAAYRVRHGATTETVIVNQASATGYVALGTFDFTGAGDEGVLLGDNTGDASSASVKVLFDAIKVEPVL